MQSYEENHSDLRDNLIPIPFICGRCHRHIQHLKSRTFYHCLGCIEGPAGEGFDLCAECAAVGIYCADDNHAWSPRQRQTTGDGKRWRITGDIITPQQARTLAHAFRKTYPVKFYPPRESSPNEGWLPENMFCDEYRFIRSTDPREILLYTGGCTLSRSEKGRPEVLGGFAFGYRATTFARDGRMTHRGTISGRLENLGPTGSRHSITQDRADLRAVVAALQFTPWNLDCNRGWRSLVIATASNYIVKNLTEGTTPRAWETEGDTPPDLELYEFTNEDLWKLMIYEIRKLQKDGVQVRFWETAPAGDYNGGIDRCLRYAQQAAIGIEQEEFEIIEAREPWKLVRSPSQNSSPASFSESEVTGIVLDREDTWL